MTTASVSAHAPNGPSGPPITDPLPGRPAEDADALGPEDTRSLAQRIEDARAMVAYQDLGGGLSLAFKVRPVGPDEAAQVGVLLRELQRQIGVARKPDPEDMTGLQAAEMEAAKGSEADQLERQLVWIRDGRELARRCVTHVRDIDDPTTWRRVEWVSQPSQQGDVGDDAIRLHLETLLDTTGLINISLAALRWSEEAAGRWGRFRR